MSKTLIEKMEAKRSPRSWIREVNGMLHTMDQRETRIDEYLETIDTLAREKEALEFSLAEYENDETNRRREDALKIRTLEREICTCPWPADAAKTRHLLSCRLMQMEHEALRAKEKANGNETRDKRY